MRTPRPQGSSQHSPGWSGNGRRLLFVTGGAQTFRAFQNNIWVMRPNGTGLRSVLTRSTLLKLHPAIGSAVWSPDGRRIAFTAIAYELKKEAIYTVNVDGTGLRRLLAIPLNLGAGDPAINSVAWSPDGRKLAYSIGPTGRVGIHVMRSDGRRARRLYSTELTGNPLLPGIDWSPDGRSIVFTGLVRGTGNCPGSPGEGPQEPGVFLISASGGQPRIVVSGSCVNDPTGNFVRTQAFAPTFSPDGREIAFMHVVSPRRGTTEAWLMRVRRDGSGLRRVLQLNLHSAHFHTADLFQPSWQALPR